MIRNLNYKDAGVFPDYFVVKGKITKGSFEKTLRRYDYLTAYSEEEEAEFSYQFSFTYRFNFIYRKSISGIAYVYHGGFYIEYKKPFEDTYISSHCNHFSMPFCRHFNENGEFTQYCIDRIAKVLESEYRYMRDTEND